MARAIVKKGSPYPLPGKPFGEKLTPAQLSARRAKLLRRSLSTVARSERRIARGGVLKPGMAGKVLVVYPAAEALTNITLGEQQKRRMKAKESLTGQRFKEM